MRERDLQAKGVRYLSASYPFNDHGKSILMEANYGYVKVLAEPGRGRILGAEIVGIDAGELIHCFSGPLAMRATVFDLLRAPVVPPHPGRNHHLSAGGNRGTGETVSPVARPRYPTNPSKSPKSTRCS